MKPVVATDSNVSTFVGSDCSFNDSGSDESCPVRRRGQPRQGRLRFTAQATGANVDCDADVGSEPEWLRFADDFDDCAIDIDVQAFDDIEDECNHAVPMPSSRCRSSGLDCQYYDDCDVGADDEGHAPVAPSASRFTSVFCQALSLKPVTDPVSEIVTSCMDPEGAGSRRPQATPEQMMNMMLVFHPAPDDDESRVDLIEKKNEVYVCRRDLCAGDKFPFASSKVRPNL